MVSLKIKFLYQLWDGMCLCITNTYNSSYHLLSQDGIFCIGSNRKFYNNGLSLKHLIISHHEKSRDTLFHG